MTFIASVVAKKGVAIVADSLVTSSLPILHYRKFLDHLAAQPKTEAGDISINPDDIQGLFSFEPIYTKDYEEKLFRLNKYTAITTTGIAEINDKKIIDIVNEFIAVREADIEDFSIPLDTKLDQFRSHLTTQIQEHLGKHPQIGSATFIVTFYERSTAKTHIYKLYTQESDKEALTNPNHEYVKVVKQNEWVKVVCDGQNKLSDNILYGIGKTLYERFPEMVQKILGKLPLSNDQIPANFVADLIEDPYFNGLFFSEVELLNLTNLSLQQAVDLASLLMRLEVDFQKYTRDIPTVGGVIKLAVIDENGFELISGHKILPPRHITI